MNFRIISSLVALAGLVAFPGVARAEHFNLCVTLQTTYSDQAYGDYATDNTFAARGIKVEVLGTGSSVLAEGHARAENPDVGCFSFDAPVNDIREFRITSEVRVGKDGHFVYFYSPGSDNFDREEVLLDFSTLPFDPAPAGTASNPFVIPVLIRQDDFSEGVANLLAGLGFAMQRVDAELQSLRSSYTLTGNSCNNDSECSVVETCRAGSCDGDWHIRVRKNTNDFSSAAFGATPAWILYFCDSETTETGRYNCLVDRSYFGMGAERFWGAYPAGASRKSVIIHEMGHIVQSAYGIPGPGSYSFATPWTGNPGQEDVSLMCRYNQGDPLTPSTWGDSGDPFPWGKGHGLRSHEWYGAAYGEGLVLSLITMPAGPPFGVAA